jgi:hypothetical protein
VRSPRCVEQLGDAWRQYHVVAGDDARRTRAGADLQMATTVLDAFNSSDSSVMRSTDIATLCVAAKQRVGQTIFLIFFHA